MSADARRGLRAGMGARRALLGIATFWVWGRLGWTLTLSAALSENAMGRAPWLAAPLRAAAIPLFVAMAALSVGIATRRFRIPSAALAFAIMWLVDYAVDDPHTEKSHVLLMVMLLVHAAVGAWRGRGRGAERTAWDVCCAVAASAYLLSAWAKLSRGGIFWAHPHYLQLLAMNATAQAHGVYRALRLAVALGPPWIAAFGGSYSLLVEFLGPVMLVRRWRPYYLLALLAMHGSIYAVMGIFWGAQMLLLFALLFPFEAAAIRALKLFKKKRVRALASLAALLALAAAPSRAAAMKTWRDATYRNIEGAVAAGGIEKLEQLLALLPADLRSSFTLAYESRSVQGASPESPRVIMFRPDGKLALTFNGDPAQAGYDRLEIMEYRDATASFELHELSFPGDARGRAADADGRGANPKRCLGCHSDEPHPIWSSYYVWRGMYGSKDDYPTGDEAANLKKFVAAAPAHPRYRFLVFRSDATRLHYLEQEPLEFPDEPKMKNRPNARLGMLLGKLSAIRLAEALARSPAVARRKYAVLHRLLRCATPFAARAKAAAACYGREFQDARVRGLMTTAGVDGRRYLLALMPEELSRRAVPPGRDANQRALSFFDGTAGQDDFEEMVGLRLAKIWLGKDFAKGRPVAEAALYDPEHGGHEIVDEQEKNDLAALAEDRVDELRDPQALCAVVAARGAASAAGKNEACPEAAPSPGAESRSRVAGTLRGCAGCHDGGGHAPGYSNGPLIPFDDENALRARLGGDPALVGRVAERLDAHDGDPRLMPLFGPALSRTQRDEVLSYLESLAPPAAPAGPVVRP